MRQCWRRDRRGEGGKCGSHPSRQWYCKWGEEIFWAEVICHGRGGEVWWGGGARRRVVADAVLGLYRQVSHHHTYYVTSSYILCHIIIPTMSHVADADSTGKGTHSILYGGMRLCHIIIHTMSHHHTYHVIIIPTMSHILYCMAEEHILSWENTFSPF